MPRQLSGVDLKDEAECSRSRAAAPAKFLLGPLSSDWLRACLLCPKQERKVDTFQVGLWATRRAAEYGRLRYREHFSSEGSSMLRCRHSERRRFRSS